jgi:hypothetical protein
MSHGSSNLHYKSSLQSDSSTDRKDCIIGDATLEKYLALVRRMVTTYEACHKFSPQSRAPSQAFAAHNAILAAAKMRD